MRSLALWASVIFLGSGGCQFQWDLPADLIPVSQRPGVSEETWNDVVVRAAERWNTALELVGCGHGSTFDVSLTGHEGHIVLLTTFPAGSGKLGELLEGTGRLNVYAEDPLMWEHVVTHELGHAMGLLHSLEGSGGIMEPRYNGALGPAGFEAERAAQELGCR